MIQLSGDAVVKDVTMKTYQNGSGQLAEVTLGWVGKKGEQKIPTVVYGAEAHMMEKFIGKTMFFTGYVAGREYNGKNYASLVLQHMYVKANEAPTASFSDIPPSKDIFDEPAF